MEKNKKRDEYKPPFYHVPNTNEWQKSYQKNKNYQNFTFSPNSKRYERQNKQQINPLIHNNFDFLNREQGYLNKTHCPSKYLNAQIKQNSQIKTKLNNQPFGQTPSFSKNSYHYYSIQDQSTLNSKIQKNQAKRLTSPKQISMQQINKKQCQQSKILNICLDKLNYQIIDKVQCLKISLQQFREDVFTQIMNIKQYSSKIIMRIVNKYTQSIQTYCDERVRQQKHKYEIRKDRQQFQSIKNNKDKLIFLTQKHKQVLTHDHLRNSHQNKSFIKNNSINNKQIYLYKDEASDLTNQEKYKFTNINEKERKDHRYCHSLLDQNFQNKTKKIKSVDRMLQNIGRLKQTIGMRYIKCLPNYKIAQNQKINQNCKIIQKSPSHSILKRQSKYNKN